MSETSPEYPAQQGAPPYATAGTDGFAITSLVLGIVGLVLFAFFGIVASIAAVIFGHLSLRRIRAAGPGRGGRGLAIAGLVLGYIGTALWILLIAIVGVGIGLS